MSLRIRNCFGVRFIDLPGVIVSFLAGNLLCLDGLIHRRRPALQDSIRRPQQAVTPTPLNSIAHNALIQWCILDPKNASTPKAQARPQLHHRSSKPFRLLEQNPLDKNRTPQFMSQRIMINAVTRSLARVNRGIAI